VLAWATFFVGLGAGVGLLTRTLNAKWSGFRATLLVAGATAVACVAMVVVFVTHPGEPDARTMALLDAVALCATGHAFALVGAVTIGTRGLSTWPTLLLYLGGVVALGGSLFYPFLAYRCGAHAECL
jgi:hypothetical protein